MGCRVNETSEIMRDEIADEVAAGSDRSLDQRAAKRERALVQCGNTTEACRGILAIEYRRVLQDGHAASVD